MTDWTVVRVMKKSWMTPSKRKALMAAKTRHADELESARAASEFDHDRLVDAAADVQWIVDRDHRPLVHAVDGPREGDRLLGLALTPQQVRQPGIGRRRVLQQSVLE